MDLAPFPPQERLYWAVHPLLDEPRAKSGLLIAILLALSAGVSISFESVGYGLLTLGLLTASLSRYFLPTRYALDARGVVISHLSVRRQIPWGRFRRVCVYPEGVFLSPFSRPNRLEPFRGCFLRFGKHRDEVIHGVQTHIDCGAS